MATKKNAAKKSSSTKARAKVGKVMHEFKEGQLKSGGRRKVKNPKQAIAIGLSEARRAGAKIPKKGAAKKTAAKKGTAKKTAAKKAAPSKSAAKKAPAKKSAAKKTAAKKSSARKK